MRLVLDQIRLGMAAVELTPRIEAIADFGPCVLVGLEDDDAIQAVAVIHRNTGFDAMLTLACRGPRWGYSLRTLGKIIGKLAFGVLQCKRLTAKCAKGNKAARRLLGASGFRLEGVMPLAWDGRQSACIYGVRAQHFRWQ